jgi:uncharacterized protein YggE
MRALAVIGIAATVLLTGATGAGGVTSAMPVQRSIVVTGSASVSTVPDRAQVSFGVSSTAKTASGALRANSNEMAKVIAAIKAQGIAAADIRTESVSLSPRTSPNGDEIVGYAAFNSVSVTIRSLGKVGPAIDAAVEAGANQVSGPSLIRSDSQVLYRQALRAAIANARAKAQTIARASGLALRRITGVTEGSSGPPQPLATAKDAAASVPIEPGTQVVEATVTVAFSAA